MCQVEIEHQGGDASRLWKLAQRLACDLPLVPLAIQQGRARLGPAQRNGPPTDAPGWRMAVDAAAPVVMR